MNGYQLLNEVGSGGTLSSLFTILSLFTEDVQMSWQDDDPGVSLDDISTLNESVPPLLRQSRKRANSDVPPFDLGSSTTPLKMPRRRSSVSSTTSTVHAPEFTSYSRAGPDQPTHDDASTTSRTSTPHFHRTNSVRPTQVHRGVVARATVDTTLAVIPAEAFRRLTKKFPKATGHIVQGRSLF